MQVFKLGFVAAVMVCALSAIAQAADCTRVAAIGDNVTHDLAVLFSTNALKNTIARRGLIGKGPVKTTCKTGSAMIECYSSQMACKGGRPRPAWAPGYASEPGVRRALVLNSFLRLEPRSCAGHYPKRCVGRSWPIGAMSDLANVPEAEVVRPRSKSRKPPLIRSAHWAIPAIVAGLPMLLMT